MSIPFNRDLITDQMSALGLTERGIVQQTSIPYFAFCKARQQGTFEPTLTLRQLQALADTLGLTPSELLSSSDNADEPAREKPRPAKDDAATVIPLLVDLPKMVPIDHIARSLGWNQDRLDAALQAVPHALDGTGLRLHTNIGRIKITASAPTDKQLKRALGKARTLGLGLNTYDANVLNRIINGDNVLDRQPSNPTRVSVGTLKNMGCIAPNDQAVFEPTEALRLALPDL